MMNAKATGSWWMPRPLGHDECQGHWVMMSVKATGSWWVSRPPGHDEWRIAYWRDDASRRSINARSMGHITYRCSARTESWRRLQKCRYKQCLWAKTTGTERNEQTQSNEIFQKRNLKESEWWQWTSWREIHLSGNFERMESFPIGQKFEG